MKKLFLLLLTLPMAAQTLISHVAATSGPTNPSPFYITLPSAPTVGDALVLFCSTYQNDDCAKTTDGWTKIASQGQSGGTLGSQLYYHVAQVGDGTTYALYTGNKANAQLFQLRGTDAVYPVTDYASSLAGSTGTTPATPSVTPTHNGLYQLACVAQDEASTATGAASGWTFYASAGYGHGAACSSIPTLTSGTSTPVSTTFTLSAPETYGLAAWTILVNPTGTSGLLPASLTLSASPTTTTNGANVALTSTATPSAVTGTVTFTNLTTSSSLGTCTLSGGTCTLNTTAIPQGANNISASVPAGGTYGPASSNAVTVTNISTVTTLTTSENAFVVGKTIIATASATPVAATGTMTFKEGATTLGSCTAAALAVAGDATTGPTGKGCSINLTPTTGVHTFTAIFSGDGTYPGSSTTYVVVVSAVQTSPVPYSSISLGNLGSWNGFVMNPNDDLHQDLSALPVDPLSSTFIGNSGVGHLHHDGGFIDSGCNGVCGIPYTVVSTPSQPLVPYAFASTGESYPNDSDISPYPLPSNIPIEANPPDCTLTGDDHSVAIDIGRGVANEIYQTNNCSTSTPRFTVAATVSFPVDQPVENRRPWDLTSSDVSGLSLIEGIVRYDEVYPTCTLNHAMRITFSQIGRDNTINGNNGRMYLPVTHSSPTNGPTSMPTGGRLLLNSSFDTSGYGSQAKCILDNAKTRGFYVADLGGSGYFTLTADSRFDNTQLNTIDAISISNFYMPELPTPYAANRYPALSAPTINSFSISPSTVSLGSSVTVSWNTTSGSYSYTDKFGVLRDSTTGALGSGSMSWTPTALGVQTVTMTTNGTNLVGDDGSGDGSRPTASATVTVTGGTPNLTISGRVKISGAAVLQ